MSTGVWVLIIGAAVGVVVLAFVFRASVEVGGSGPGGWKGWLRARRAPKPVPAPTAIVADVTGRNVTTTSTGSVSVNRVEAKGDVVTRAGDTNSVTDPKA